MSDLSYLEYQTLVEQAPIMIWRAGLDTTCNYFNEAWLSFTGRTMEQEQGHGWTEGVHADDLDRCMKIFLNGFQKREIFEMEYRLRRRDHLYRWIFDRGVPFTDPEGNFAGYIGSCIDVTERVEAQEALLRAKEAELRKLRNFLPICASCKKIRDDQGYWNQIESYLKEHSAMEFSHSVCPDCASKLYPDYLKRTSKSTDKA